jgi:hypothetical protein
MKQRAVDYITEKRNEQQKFEAQYRAILEAAEKAQQKEKKEVAHKDNDR